MKGGKNLVLVRDLSLHQFYKEGTLKHGYAPLGC